MAIYQMGCTCGKQLDVTIPMKDFPPKAKCPKCNEAMQQVFTPPAVRAYYSPLHPRHRRGQGGILREYGSRG